VSGTRRGGGCGGAAEEEAALDDDEAEAALSLFHSNWKKGMLRPSPSKDAGVTINYLPNLAFACRLS